MNGSQFAATGADPACLRDFFDLIKQNGFLQPTKHVPGILKQEPNDFGLVLPNGAGKPTEMMGSSGAVCEGCLDDDLNIQGSSP